MSFLVVALQDPNIVYLALLAGLWMVVTVIYTPGTGIGEAIGFVLIVATIYALGQMPTNWVAVLLVIIGASGFLALPFVSMRWANVADLGLVLQGLGGLFLFNGVQVSPVVIVATLLVAWAYHRFLLLPIVRRHKELATVEQAGIVGARGRVLKTLNPVGTVQINGESWTARSEKDEEIASDVEILVTEKIGLELRVKKAKRNQQD